MNKVFTGYTGFFSAADMQQYTLLPLLGFAFFAFLQIFCGISFVYILFEIVAFLGFYIISAYIQGGGSYFELLEFLPSENWHFIGLGMVFFALSISVFLAIKEISVSKKAKKKKNASNGNVKKDVKISPTAEINNIENYDFNVDISNLTSEQALSLLTHVKVPDYSVFSTKKSIPISDLFEDDIDFFPEKKENVLLPGSESDNFSSSGYANSDNRGFLKTGAVGSDVSGSIIDKISFLKQAGLEKGDDGFSSLKKKIQDDQKVSEKFDSVKKSLDFDMDSLAEFSENLSEKKNNESSLQVANGLTEKTVQYGNTENGYLRNNSGTTYNGAAVFQNDAGKTNAGVNSGSLNLQGNPGTVYGNSYADNAYFQGGNGAAVGNIGFSQNNAVNVSNGNGYAINRYGGETAGTGALDNRPFQDGVGNMPAGNVFSGDNGGVLSGGSYGGSLYSGGGLLNNEYAYSNNNAGIVNGAVYPQNNPGVSTASSAYPQSVSGFAPVINSYPQNTVTVPYNNVYNGNQINNATDMPFNNVYNGIQYPERNGAGVLTNGSSYPQGVGAQPNVNAYPQSNIGFMSNGGGYSQNNAGGMPAGNVYPQNVAGFSVDSNVYSQNNAGGAYNRAYADNNPSQNLTGASVNNFYGETVYPQRDAGKPINAAQHMRNSALSGDAGMGSFQNGSPAFLSGENAYSYFDTENGRNKVFADKRYYQNRGEFLSDGSVFPSMRGEAVPNREMAPQSGSAVSFGGVVNSQAGAGFPANVGASFQTRAEKTYDGGFLSDGSVFPSMRGEAVPNREMAPQSGSAVSSGGVVNSQAGAGFPANVGASFQTRAEKTYDGGFSSVARGEAVPNREMAPQSGSAVSSGGVVNSQAGAGFPANGGAYSQSGSSSDFRNFAQTNSAFTQTEAESVAEREKNGNRFSEKNNVSESDSLNVYSEKARSKTSDSESGVSSDSISNREEPAFDDVSAVGGLKSSVDGSYVYDSSKYSYVFPPESLLKHYQNVQSAPISVETDVNGRKIVDTFAQFKIKTQLVGIQKGPAFTLYELALARGIKVGSVVNYADNIAMDLAVKSVRILAPIPGLSAIGVEVPNKEREIIGFDVMMSALKSKKCKVPMVLGRTITGESVVIDLADTPHLLIAGTTGSGKSVCVNGLICSILYTKTPKEVRMIMVDPKMVELSVYNDIPHLLTPVITDSKRAIKAISFVVEEMERRMKMLKIVGAKNIEEYNRRISEGEYIKEKLPYIVVIIDEFADLMLSVGKELETYIKRITAVARFTGIHLVLATQRPSNDVITGIIKSNIPAQIAFAVSNQINSRIILDMSGAEKLLGRGDMLYASSQNRTPTRIQGAYIDSEIEEIVKFVKAQGKPDYIDESFFDEPDDDDFVSSDDSSGNGQNEDLYMKAWKLVAERGEASASYIQRKLSIGFNRASTLLEQLEENGVVGPPRGAKPREVLRYPDSRSEQGVLSENYD